MSARAAAIVLRRAALISPRGRARRNGRGPTRRACASARGTRPGPRDRADLRLGHAPKLSTPKSAAAFKSPYGDIDAASLLPPTFFSLGPLAIAAAAHPIEGPRHPRGMLRNSMTLVGASTQKAHLNPCFQSFFERPLARFRPQSPPRRGNPGMSAVGFGPQALRLSRTYHRVVGGLETGPKRPVKWIRGRRVSIFHQRRPEREQYWSLGRLRRTAPAKLLGIPRPANPMNPRAYSLQRFQYPLQLGRRC